ncbi:MAG: response regulator [Taibaiella sp.]|nr:response regulator [Taibaiella sp.]
MNTTLPLTNWSLSKTLATQTSSFDKARVRIIFTILIFSMVKSALAITQFAIAHSNLQLIRAVIAGILYVTLTKILLSRPDKVKQLAHTMLTAGVLIVWSSIFVYSHRVNLVTTQFILMIVLSSFYTLGTRLGAIYSVAATLPVVLLFVLQDMFGILQPLQPEETYLLGIKIVIGLNFASIVVAHHLFYMALRDSIAEKEELNKQLELSINEARELAATRSNFLSTMSHELRTPLNSVVGIAELLIEDKPTERQRENLQILHSSAIDLLSLINNVLDINKIDSRKLELEKVTFSLSRFLDDLTRSFRKRAEEKHLDFHLNVDTSLSNVVVNSDPTRLAQVMYNLLSNALKFTDTGSISVSANIIGKTQDRITVAMSVTDTGIGIAADRQSAVFEAFAQASADTTRNYGGSGLGLAIVRQVLQLLGSKIEMESEIGKGSRFYFTLTLPLAETTSPAATSSAVAPEIRHLRILVAEDDKVNRLIIKKQLARLQLEAEIVENGQLALDATMTKPFDVILLDLHMPVLNGYETIKTIRNREEMSKARAYVVAFTAAVTEQEQIMAAGFDDFLYKPVQLADLQKKLEQAITRGAVTAL